MLPSLVLDDRSETPLYRQLFDQIRAAIEAGQLRGGERLPATRELAGLLGLNRTTVSAAYALLEAEGVLRAHVGRGSFVIGGTGAPAAPGLRWEQLLTRIEPPPPAPSAPARISFAASRPSEDLFPLAEFGRTCSEVTGGAQAAAILQLGYPGGYPPLCDYLFEQALGTGTARPTDDIAIVSGCQQALDLLQRVLAPAGETIVVEDPVYPGLKNVFARAGARLVGLPVGDHGVDADAFTRALREHRPRLAVLTPNFQNPTGVTMPLGARRAVVSVAREYGVALVENDIYGDLRYEGEAVASLKQIDEVGDVIQLRSFSKIAFPGLRVGWVIGPRPVVARIAEAKQWADLHTDQLSQAILLRFAESGRLEAHLRRIRAVGTEQLAATLAACGRYLPAGSHFTRPRGGMNLWIRLPDPLDASELLGEAQRRGVTYVPGRYFAVAQAHPGTLRLSFAGLAPERIETGIRTLGAVFGEAFERSSARSRSELVPAMV